MISFLGSISTTCVHLMLVLVDSNAELVLSFLIFLAPSSCNLFLSCSQRQEAIMS